MQPHEFWQEFEPEGEAPEALSFADVYPARLPDGRVLRLPIRPRAEGGTGLASLIISQASFHVQESLAKALAERAAEFSPEVVVGLPTLGLTLASAVARRLRHERYVPLGTSKKFWYDEALSVPLSSVTSPDHEKRLYLDPRMLPLIAGKRVLLVDDVISSGSSAAAGITLLAACGVTPIALGAAMLQSDRWRETLSALDPSWPEKTVAVFSTPLLKRCGERGCWMA
ncbi:phosphoribosyltransferase [Consotaella salsifontis]|uniref:Adenine/guanine phosphoribosyltransferase n=1 Tax=Consotaella salsifontis TaxID=1365950 RepID=A0A1T4MPU9_9HYPH|nr:phosphoribosyltransferase [Consotaella salsifontis]SJZ69079.1 Adenine/guanine phosphoribosyltransferase [Consotaella salsifontis]